MRFVGFAYAALLLLPLAAFRVGVAGENGPEPAPDPEAALPSQATTPISQVTDRHSGEQPEERSSVEQPEERSSVEQLRAHPSVEQPQERQSVEQSQERQSVEQAQERRRDWRRRRSRNRYPGPIPTPADWAPPEGPVKIALQAGHWRADEAPRELSGLRGGGTRWQSTPEWKANLEIAERAGRMLEELGYEVDILPAVVPPSYRAHLFISIHADGSEDPRASGYRVAAPSRDATGRAGRAASLLERSYGDATGLSLIPTVTRRMRNYYAFNFRRYEHALHPMTIAVILETGFMTSSRDRSIIMDAPERAARGIVDAVVAFPETSLQGVAAERQR